MALDKDGNMTPEVRRAALRMAAKVALVATTTGCWTEPTHPGPAQPTARQDTHASADTCETYLDKLGSVARAPMSTSTGPMEADDPLYNRNDVYGAFADVAARSAPRTQSCCSDEIAQGGSGKHRWECCSAVPASTGVNRIACTPWGPPSPPEMPLASNPRVRLC
ncbi:hypothetical protein BH11MYX2_BH11MYX2_08110 [soil metagenome]